MDRTARFAWFVIGWSVVTILLGAFVRATHSGAGCGPSWPTCRGVVIPALDGATAIEFTHRVASGLALIITAVLIVLVWRRQPKGHPARRSAAWAGFAVIAEALIGAAIVLYEWVANDASLARAISVPLHLVNTLLLLAALTLTAWFLSGGGQLHRAGKERRFLAIGAVGLVLIAASGAVTALADTLFPSGSLAEGVAADFSTTEHFLTRLRIIHPLFAVAVVVASLVATRRAGVASTAGRRFAFLVLMQLGLGAVNVVLGTPLWLQLIHLATADAIWISYVWLTAQVLSSKESSSLAELTGAWHTNPVQR